MLKRFNRIKNIGKFYDVSAGGMEFKKETIIFGNNGNGKSTLTAILRSLTKGNNNILVGRKSFGSTAQKEVEIGIVENLKNVVYSFKNKKWNNIYPYIDIFDSHFISENIYDGEQIIEEHKVNLHRCVVGKQGKDLVEQIKKLNENIKIKTTGKTEKINHYSTSECKKYFTIDNFIQIQEDSKISNKIENITKELHFAKQLNKPKELSFEQINFDNFRGLFSKNFQTCHDEAERKIKEHIQKDWKDEKHSWDFLQEGLNLTKIPFADNNCPFCEQRLNAVTELLNAYKDYFDQAYEKYQKDIQSNIKALTEWDISSDLETLLREATNWGEFLDSAVEVKHLKVTLDKVRIGLQNAKDVFTRECDNKIKDPDCNVNFDSLTILENKCKDIDDQIKRLNTSIVEFCKKIETKNEIELENELGRLKIIKLRYEKEWQQFCEDYKSLQIESEDLKLKRDNLIKELSQYSQDTFKKHQKYINDILEQIGADFKIKDFNEKKDTRRTESVFCGFELEFFGKHLVAIEGQEFQPHFNNTLSQGDRGTIAFAFFLSILYHDPEIEKKIIVIDDPISSFDEERRRKTVQFLADIKNFSGKEPLQKIILTHEKNFLIRIATENKFLNAKFLKIIPDGLYDGNKKCKIDHCDIYEEFLKPDEFKYLEEIKEYTDSNKTVPNESYDKGRIIMESVFKRKYYIELKNEIVQNKSISSFVDKLFDLGIYDVTKKDRFIRLCDDLHIPHHDVVKKEIKDTSPGDQISILKDVLKMIKEI